MEYTFDRSKKISNIENILQKLIDERRMSRENDDRMKKFIEDKRNAEIDMIRKTSLLCFGMFNQQLVNDSPQN